MRMPVARFIVAMAAVLSLSSSSRAFGAAAGYFVYQEGGTGGGYEQVVNQLSALFLLLPGVPLVLNAAENALADKGEGISKGRAIANHIFSGLGLAAGASLIIAAPSNGKSLLSGGVLVGLGALNLGLTLYRSRSKVATRPVADLGLQLSLTPVTGVGARGGAFGGVGLRVAGF